MERLDREQSRQHGRGAPITLSRIKIVVASLVVALLVGQGLAEAEVCVATKLPRPWRSGGFLWKPKAEHYDGLVVVTLPRKSVVRVQVLSRRRKVVKVLPFRSRGDAGDAFADYKCTGACYQGRYGRVYVQVIKKDGTCREYYIRNPALRSDGLQK